MGQAERRAKVEETSRVALEIIDAEAAAREAKTERLRQARLAKQSASSTATVN